MTDMFEAQRHSKGRLQFALFDLLTGARSIYLWVNLGLEDLRSRYRRTYFGYLWLVLLYFIQVAVFIMIFAPLRGMGLGTDNYPEYLAFGFLAWMFVSSGVNTGSTVFVSAKNWIMSANVPYSLFIYRNIFREILPMLINLTLLLIIVAVVGDLHPLGMLAALAMLPVYIVNFFWVSLFLGTICARLRDIEQFLSVVMRISFFLTPIIWTYDPDGEALRSRFAMYNPFTHFIEVFRQPMMGGWPEPVSYLVVAGFTVFGSVLGLIVFAYNRRRLPFWL